MKIIYYLKTCSTCQRILKELVAAGANMDSIKLVNIKTDPLTEKQVDELKALSGSYEAIFSKKAMKYKALGLASKNLSEADYKNYLLEDYTFLKRPVAIIDQEIFIGNSKAVVTGLTKKLIN